MRKFPFAIAGILAIALSPAQAVQIDVIPWLAPNGWGSPSFNGAEANAVQAMYQGLTSYGTPGTPTYFQAQSNVTSAEAIVTGFPSWLGRTDPGAVFGPAFAGELGNRMTFALRIDGQNSQFSISQLSLSTSSSDPSNLLAWNWAAGTYNYGPGYLGVLKGSDGKLGTADDIFITSGPNTTLVDALFGRGSGNSFDAYCPSCSLADQQTALLAAAAYPGSAFTFTGTYQLANSDGIFASGSGTFQVSETPLPAALPLFAGGLGVMGVLGWGRRKKVKAAA